MNRLAVRTVAARRRGDLRGGRLRAERRPTADPGIRRVPRRRLPRLVFAAHGATLAEDAGFHACSLAVEAAPTWQGIVETADRHGASVIVLGPHRRSRLLGQLDGSVVGAALAHTDIPVLAIPELSTRTRALGIRGALTGRHGREPF